MREAWRLIRSSYPELIDDIADGKRFVWLGSGISRDQVPDLVELLAKVLQFLRDQAKSGRPDAADHENALLTILGEHLPDEKSRYSADPTNWVPINLEVLRDSYSRVLSVGVTGKPNDYLLIEGARLPNLYGDPTIEPGPTHKALAILIYEGVITNLASGNWDGLVERALVNISGTDTLLNVYVDVNDPRDANGTAEIAKFHGCAVLTLKDMNRYRDKIIATRAQITKLHGDEAFAHMRDRLRDLTTRTRSLILGLSVQDDDLLTLFQASTNRSPWPWEANQPAYLFAEPELQSSQKDALEVAYGELYGRERIQITDRSALGAYAGPVISALLIEVLATKLTTILHSRQPFPSDMVGNLEQGIRRLVLRTIAAFGTDEDSLITFILNDYSNMIRTYLGASTTGGASYIPFAYGNRNKLKHNFTVIPLGLNAFAAAIGLIGQGELTHRWCVSLESFRGSSRIRILRKGKHLKTTLIIVRGAKEAIEVMGNRDWINSGENMALLQMDAGSVTNTRSPVGRIGRGLRKPPRYEMTWDQMTDSVKDMDDLLNRFETGMRI